MPGARQDQVRAVVDSLRTTSCVIVGADLNSHGLGGVLTDDAFDWPTRDIKHFLSTFLYCSSVFNSCVYS